MHNVTAAQRGIPTPSDLALELVERGVDVDPDVDGYTELSDLELLAAALHDALTAHCSGVLGGPGIDEVALQQAARRARRRDANTLLRTQVGRLQKYAAVAA
jgi:hypothetical protein